MKTLLCIPTLNAANHVERLLQSIQNQQVQPDYIVIVDSGSNDGSLEIFRSVPGIQVMTINPSQFNHGGTRQLVVNAVPQADVIFFLTQDAVLVGKNDFALLMTYFQDEKVGAVYGRQLPRKNAGEIEAHARYFNYPTESRVRSISDVSELGIKAAFFSNSFAAYRRSALQGVGGFPVDVILGEDTYVVARMLLQGWKVAYCAEGQVFHSHGYSVRDEFRRYFDIGVFHGQEPWLRREFGQPSGEGSRYVRSEIAYLLKGHPSLIPEALVRSAFKLSGYRLGLLSHYFPLWLNRRLSLHHRYWDRGGSLQ